MEKNENIKHVLSRLELDNKYHEKDYNENMLNFKMAKKLGFEYEMQNSFELSEIYRKILNTNKEIIKLLEEYLDGTDVQE